MKGNWRFALMVGLLLTSISSTTWATVTWVGVGENLLWSTPTNWDQGALPTSNDNVEINSPDDQTISLDSQPVTINSLLLRGGNTLVLDPETSSQPPNEPGFKVFGGETFIGKDGLGTFSHVNGYVRLDELFIGSGAGSEGSYIMNGGRLETVSEVIGSNGAKWGELIQTGGIHSIFGDIEVGIDSQGTLALENDAQLNVDGSMYLGLTNGEGTLGLAGSSVIGIQDRLVVGAGGTGTVYQGFQGRPDNPVDSTTDLSVQTLVIGEGQGAAGRYLMNSGTLLTGTTLIGRNGADWSDFVQTGGEHTVRGNIVVGDTSDAGLILENDAKLSVGGDIILGRNNGMGFLGLSGRSVIGITGDLILGSDAAGYVYHGFEGRPANPVDSKASLNVGNLVIEGGTGSQGEYHLHSGTLRAESLINDGKFVYTGGSVSLGSFNQGSGGFMEITLSDSFQTIDILGEAWLDGILKINLMEGYTPESDSTFTLFNAVSIMFPEGQPSFASLLGPDGWSLEPLIVDIGDLSSFQVRMSAPAPVPLPGAAILMGSGLLGLIGLRRRQIV